MRIVRILFLTAGLLPFILNAQVTEKPNLNIREIIFVFKTHFDNGYDDMAESVIDKYATTMMDQALATLEKSRSLPPEQHFVWTLPAWPLTEILERCRPESKPLIEAAVREGWFAYHSLPFTFETEAGDPEALVRSLVCASDLSKKYNLPLPRDAKMTDVPSHSWFLPTLLSNAGIKILHIGCNSASRSPEVPLLFWWQGPDGSKLMTIYWGRDYGTTIVPDAEWKHKTWLAIIHTGDNQGPPSPEDVTQVLEKTRKLAPNAKLRIGRISDFYDAIMKENPELPVVKGDMPDTWIHGYMSMPREMKNVRALQKDIYALELLNTLLNNSDTRKTDIRRITADATGGVLLWDEHTFGLSMKDGLYGDWHYGEDFIKARAAGTYKRFETSWKEKGDRVYQAEKIIEPAYDREMKRLASKVSSDGERIVVFNPLPWERSGLITVQHSTNIRALKDLRTGKIFPVDNRDNILRFVAENIPSSGYTTFIPAEPVSKNVSGLASDWKNNIIENEFLRVKIDPAKGCIISVIDKKTGMEMVDQQSATGFGQYVYERFSRKDVNKYVEQYVKINPSGWAESVFGKPRLDDTPYKRVNGGKAKASYFSDAISAKAVLMFAKEEGNPHNYSLVFNLYSGLPFLELTWFIDSKPADPWPEAGWISFPFNVRNPQFKVGRLGAVAEPKKDFVKGSDFDFYLINNGIAIHDERLKGFALSTPDAPGISLDMPGLWKYTGNFLPQKPDVYVNLYNNQWSTNFTEWIEGSWSVKMYLWSLSDFRNENSLITPNEEFRSPLMASIASEKSGYIPTSLSGIILSRKGVLVTAFGPDPFGNGTILRLMEQAGDSGKCRITMAEGFSFKKAVPINLRGERTGTPIAIKDNFFETELSAYQLLTFLFKN